MLSGLREQIHNYLYVRISIGGKEYKTSRKILNKIPESLFAKMLAGKEGEFVKKEYDGSYFIDHDGTFFHHTLNNLRDGKP